jgi:hypothetical protein
MLNSNLNLNSNQQRKLNLTNKNPSEDFYKNYYTYFHDNDTSNENYVKKKQNKLQNNLSMRDLNKTLDNKMNNYNNSSMDNLQNIMNRIDTNYNFIAKNYLNKGKPSFK